MDCKKAQRLFDELSRGRLMPEPAAEVRQHLADCTDCRVLEQRAARLQRLLALKRYERPSSEYFDNFLMEFHNRLLPEPRRWTRWQERVRESIDDFLSAEPMRVWRYSFASAMGAIVILCLFWMSLRQPSELVRSPDQRAAGHPPMIMAEIPRSSSQIVAAQLPSLPGMVSADSQQAMAESVVVIPSAVPAESTTPYYVLDHISVTPAGYEVASIHF